MAMTYEEFVEHYMPHGAAYGAQVPFIMTVLEAVEKLPKGAGAGKTEVYVAMANYFLSDAGVTLKAVRSEWPPPLQIDMDDEKWLDFA